MGQCGTARGRDADRSGHCATDNHPQHVSCFWFRVFRSSVPPFLRPLFFQCDNYSPDMLMY